MARPRVPIEERLLAKVEERAGHWLWSGASNKGTPVLKVTGDSGDRPRQVAVRRLLWEGEHGQVAEGGLIVQKCTVSACVNPDHMKCIRRRKRRRKERFTRAMHDMALVLSNRYYLQLFQRGLSRRWTDPIEESSVYIHFLRAAKMVVNYDMNPQWFIKAQFKRMWPEHALPQPNQLYCENAVNRYNNWTDEYAAAQEDVISYKTLGRDRFKPEDQYLRRLAEADGVSERRALIRNCTEFGTKYLKHRGVWAKVKDRYIAWKEDTDDPSSMAVA